MRLAIPGSNQPHVHTLRSLGDCRAIIESAKGARRAIVIGASFIGLEAAAALRARGQAPARSGRACSARSPSARGGVEQLGHVRLSDVDRVTPGELAAVARFIEPFHPLVARQARNRGVTS